MAGEECKVLPAIILLVAVRVMDNLGPSERASDFLLHDDSVLAHVTLRVRVRMIRREDETVASLHDERTLTELRGTELAAEDGNADLVAAELLAASPTGILSPCGSRLYRSPRRMSGDKVPVATSATERPRHQARRDSLDFAPAVTASPENPLSPVGVIADLRAVTSLRFRWRTPDATVAVGAFPEDRHSDLDYRPDPDHWQLPVPNPTAAQVAAGAEAYRAAVLARGVTV